MQSRTSRDGCFLNVDTMLVLRGALSIETYGQSYAPPVGQAHN